MTYGQGFLTKYLRDYLTTNRRKVTSEERSIYDFYVRKRLMGCLKDAVFVLNHLDRKQFDKTAISLYNDICDLSCSFTKKYSDKTNMKYPWSKMKKYRPWIAFRFGYEVLDIALGFTQNVVDKMFGENKFYVHIMSKEAHDDYEKWFAECRDSVVKWR